MPRFCSRSPACRFSLVRTGVRAEREFLSVPFIYTCICIYIYAGRSHRFKGNEGYGTVLEVTGPVEGETVYFCLSFLPSLLVGYLRAKFFSRERGSARGRARMSLRILRRSCEATRFVDGSYNGILNSKRLPFPRSLSYREIFHLFLRFYTFGVNFCLCTNPQSTIDTV